MNILSRIFLKLFIFYFKLLSKYRKKYPSKNIHIKKKSFPFFYIYFYLRNISSDYTRVIEYLENIYIRKSYLYKRITKLESVTLIDVGSNIGLSILSFLNYFSKIDFVIGIEAEKENFKILEKNLNLWSLKKKFSYKAFNLVAANKSNIPYEHGISLHSINQKFSKEGTFRFKKSKHKSNKRKISSISINDIINKLNLIDKNIIIKIDIEGGENLLFKNNTKWLDKVCCLIIEIHDHFDPSLIDSSKNFLKQMSKYNFAVEVSSEAIFFYKK